MTIQIFSLPSGRCPVKDFMSDADPDAVAKIFKYIEDLNQAPNPMAYMQHCGWIEKMKAYKKYKLYEMKFKFNGMEYRILSHLNNGELHLIHVFYKKTQKVLKRDIEKAINIIKLYF
jgi:phage-related protein